MSNTKWTPEPWTAKPYLGAHRVWASDGAAVCEISTRRIAGIVGSPTEESNARRIVSCVNALEGVTNEELAALPKGEIARLIRERISK